MVTEAVGRREIDAAVFDRPSPATELGLLAVFVGTGVLATRSIDYQQFSAVVLLGTTVGLTLATEVVHELLHLAAFRRSGHAAEIRWRHLAVVPTGAAVPRRALLVAVFAPVVVVPLAVAVVLLLADRPLVVAAAGYVLVVSATVSVLDVATAIQLGRHPAGSAIDFDAADAIGDELESAGAGTADRDDR